MLLRYETARTPWASEIHREGPLSDVRRGATGGLSLAAGQTFFHEVAQILLRGAADPGVDGYDLSGSVGLISE